MVKFQILALVVALISHTGTPNLNEEDGVLVGKTLVRFNALKQKHDKICFVHLHGNEITSYKASLGLIEKKGGKMIRLNPDGKRDVEFLVDGKKYKFDPNRIFSTQGIKGTLDYHGHYTKNSVAQVKKLADHILGEISGSLIVALHNNTNGNFSVNSYTIGSESEAKSVYTNPKEDPDDFFIVTEKKHFDFFRKQKYNVVLLNPEYNADDGSLSIYCLRKKKRYINVEAEHGKLEKQKKMLELVYKAEGM